MMMMMMIIIIRSAILISCYLTWLMN